MKISTILDHIDSGHMALPEFQRGYVWNRDQVRGLMDSLYRRHPVGSLLVWATESASASARGDGTLAPGVVKLLLDGQQRITSLYGIVRGHPPRFFDGDERAFTGLYFHLEREEFNFYSPVHMKDDPLWIDVSALMQQGNAGIGQFVGALSTNPTHAARLGDYVGRLSAILGIKDIEVHVEEVTGRDKTIRVVVDIFNRVNSRGTQLSKGDLALAKICAEWTDARDTMKAALGRWRKAGFDFDLDWLLRSVNTVITGEAKFLHLHNVSSADVKKGLERAERAIDSLLNLVAGRLGLDHDRVLFGRFAFPVMVRYLDQRGGALDEQKERDRLLFWYVQSAMRGRYSGSTETVIDKDLELIEGASGGLDRLIDELRVWYGGLGVSPEHFKGASRGARFYPVLYMLTRTGEARDLGTGLPLKQSLLGKMNKLEVHHIFPKALLKKAGYARPERNAVANFCFLTKDTNLKVGARPPEEYLAEVEAKQPGALASQWIPCDPALWKVERYADFLEARRELLAAATNDLLSQLAGEPVTPPEKRAVRVEDERSEDRPMGGVDSEEEEQALAELQGWVSERGLAPGVLSFDLADDHGEPLAVLDLAWPEGVQPRFSPPVAVLLNEPAEVVAAASAAGFRCFTSTEGFRRYVMRELLRETDAAPGMARRELA